MGLLASGKNPAAYKSVDRTNFTATAGQTTFTLSQGYSVGDIEVFLNGIKLIDGDDYFATNGSSVVLNSGANAGDSLQVVSYNQFSAASTYTKNEADSRYMVATGQTPMQSYLRTPNYGISSWSDSATASLEASQGSGTSGVGIKAWGRSVSGSGGELTYVTDTRGASGQHIFYGYNGTSLTKFGGFDSTGRWTAPNQPMISGKHTSAEGSSIPGGGTLIQWSITANQGGFSYSSGVMTVPVSGKYLVSLSLLRNTGYGAGGTYFVQNGSNVNRMFYCDGTDYRMGSGSLIVSLGAGDSVKFTQENTNIHWYGDGTGLGSFLIQLIG